jgi:hypothetical protein
MKNLLLAALVPLLMPNVALAEAPVIPNQPQDRVAVEEPPLPWPDFSLMESPAGDWEETKLEPPPVPQPPKQRVIPVATRGGMKQITIPNRPAWKGFARGHCTSWVASKRHITFRGNANRWIPNARAAGYRIESSPIVGAVVVTNENRQYGHVAYVEAVHADGSFAISEMNVRGVGVVSRRTLRAGDPRIQGYIW